ncbi:hypothetical protein [Neisseria bacilliformis]|uniref:hypothetical protein n=1 Tax=Neisseria bacilliformis TaxID=267212 RepID=UPI00066744E7|nr:hypothetical protein [Neisseria bacilliformis]
MTLLLFCLIGAVCGLLAAWLCLPLRLHWFLLWTAAASLFFPWLLNTAQTAGLDAHEARIRMPLFVVPAAVCGFAATLFLRLIAWLARPYRPSENAAGRKNPKTKSETRKHD